MFNVKNENVSIENILIENKSKQIDGNFRNGANTIENCIDGNYIKEN